MQKENSCDHFLSDNFAFQGLNCSCYQSIQWPSCGLLSCSHQSFNSLAFYMRCRQRTECRFRTSMMKAPSCTGTLVCLYMAYFTFTFVSSFYIVAFVIIVAQCRCISFSPWWPTTQGLCGGHRCLRDQQHHRLRWVGPGSRHWQQRQGGVKSFSFLSIMISWSSKSWSAPASWSGRMFIAIIKILTNDNQGVDGELLQPPFRKPTPCQRSQPTKVISSTSSAYYHFYLQNMVLKKRLARYLWRKGFNACMCKSWLKCTSLTPCRQPPPQQWEIRRSEERH